MKTICVPKNKEALCRLDYNKSEKGDLIEISFENDIFFELSKIGFFLAINKLVHSNIDDFEDEAIIGENHLHDIINSDIFSEEKYNPEIFEFVKKIEELFFRALEYKTGVFFYF